MQEPIRKLKDALGLGERECVALVGGGGKTTLMFGLAEELNQAEKRVVTSTTTKVWYREALHSPFVSLIQTDPSWKERLKDGLEKYGHVFVGRSLLDSGKVAGIPAPLADELYRDKQIDYLILEADGSAGHPVKAPAEHEPVIPSLVTTVVAMMGLEALGRAVSPEFVFRIDLFRDLMGVILQETLTPPVLSKLFLHPRGLFKGAPQSARRVAFLNKVDLVPAEEGVRDLSRLIRGEKRRIIDRVVIGSIQKGSYSVAGVNE